MAKTNFSPKVRNKARIYTLTTSSQHQAGGPNRARNIN